MFKIFKKSRRGEWRSTQLILWYTVYCFAWIHFKVFYRIKVRGMENIPVEGPVLYVSNHQSFLDPLIIGVGTRPRPFVSLGRKTLFRNPIFGWMIRTARTIPIDQDSPSDLSSMRTCLEVLKEGVTLLVFAEGSRTHTGKVETFANGIAMLMKRGNPLIVPVAIEGAYDVWPRKSKKPKLFGKVAVEFGKPRKSSEVLVGPVTESMERLRLEVEQMRQNLRQELKLPDLPVIEESTENDAVKAS